MAPALLSEFFQACQKFGRSLQDKLHQGKGRVRPQLLLQERFQQQTTAKILLEDSRPVSAAVPSATCAQLQRSRFVSCCKKPSPSDRNSAGALAEAGSVLRLTGELTDGSIGQQRPDKLPGSHAARWWQLSARRSGCVLHLAADGRGTWREKWI